jgi:hypothetical protein
MESNIIQPVKRFLKRVARTRLKRKGLQDKNIVIGITIEI